MHLINLWNEDIIQLPVVDDYFTVCDSFFNNHLNLDTNGRGWEADRTGPWRGRFRLMLPGLHDVKGKGVDGKRKSSTGDSDGPRLSPQKTGSITQPQHL